MEQEAGEMVQGAVTEPGLCSDGREMGSETGSRMGEPGVLWKVGKAFDSTYDVCMI